MNNIEQGLRDQIDELQATIDAQKEKIDELIEERDKESELKEDYLDAISDIQGITKKHY